MNREIILHYQPGWITVRLEFGSPGEPINPHVHRFDHTMTVEAGLAVVTLGDDIYVIAAGASLTVPANVSHGIFPLEAGTVVLCDHEIRKENGNHDPEAFSPDGIPVEWLQRLTTKWGPVHAAG